MNTVVSECGKMASDIHVSEKYSDICAENVPIGFHADNTLYPAKLLSFFICVISLVTRAVGIDSTCLLCGRSILLPNGLYQVDHALCNQASKTYNALL